MTLVAIYAIVAGIMMLAQWALSLSRGQVPELESAPAEITTHLIAESLTAVMLVVSGAGLLLAAPWGRPLALCAFGMMAYAIVNSSGYFIQRRVWPPVVMFMILFLLTLMSAGILFSA